VELLVIQAGGNERWGKRVVGAQWVIVQPSTNGRGGIEGTQDCWLKNRADLRARMLPPRRDSVEGEDS